MSEFDRLKKQKEEISKRPALCCMVYSERQLKENQSLNEKLAKIRYESFQRGQREMRENLVRIMMNHPCESGDDVIEVLADIIEKVNALPISTETTEPEPTHGGDSDGEEKKS